VSLDEALDDARSLSLFAQDRLIWISSAEAVLPRGRAVSSEAEDPEDEDKSKAAANTGSIADYVANPTPGTVVVIDSARFDLTGDDKTKSDRVRKHYAAIPTVVEFAWPSLDDARMLAQDIAARCKVTFGNAEMDALLEATSGDPSRLATEIEKLALFCGREQRVTMEAISTLVPNAREATIFSLVDRIARGDRRGSLDLLDTVVREGEYLPLALTFLGGIFRLALTAKELGLRSVGDIQGHFSRQGVPMWRARAEQVYQTASRFPVSKLQQAVTLVFETDRDMKSTRPDDRTVMEKFLLRLTV